MFIVCEFSVEDETYFGMYVCVVDLHAESSSTGVKSIQVVLS